jgi:hypothetical protein
MCLDKESREFAKRVIFWYGTVIIIIAVVIAIIGSYKSHEYHMSTVSHETLWEEVEVQEVPEEIFVPSEVPLIRTTQYVNLTFEEMAFLQQIAMAEARGEDAYGQALVMRTVLIRSARTGKSIKEVFYAKGQFTTVNDPMFGHYEPNEANNQAIGMIIDGWTEKDLPVDTEWDTTKDLYYFAADGYPKYGEHAFQWGGHYFCVK